MNLGLDSVHYSKITEDSNGYETYATPKRLIDAVTANITLNRSKVKVHADDKLRCTIDDFVDGTLGMNMLQFYPEAQEDLFNVKRDANGVIVSCSEDEPDPVAILFRSKTSEGKYEYLVLYRVQFSAPNRQFNTKADSTTVNTPTAEATIMPRQKPRYDGDHPIGANIVDDGTPETAAVIAEWFNSVYEPVNPAASQTPAEPAETTPGTTG